MLNDVGIEAILSFLDESIATGQDSKEKENAAETAETSLDAGAGSQGSTESLSKKKASITESISGGIKSILSHVTKGRPKPKRKITKPEETEKETTENVSDGQQETAHPQDEVPAEAVEESTHDLPEQDPVDTAEETKGEEPPAEVQPKKYVPHNAMSALANIMNDGLKTRPSVSVRSPNDHAAPRPVTMIDVGNPKVSIEQRASSVHYDDVKLNPETGEAEVPDAGAEPPKLAPRPPPRSDSRNAGTVEGEGNADYVESPKKAPTPLPKPMRTDSTGSEPPKPVFRAESPLAGSNSPASSPSLPPKPANLPVPEPSTPSDTAPVAEQSEPTTYLSKEEQYREELARQAQRVASPKPTGVAGLGRPTMMPTGPALHFKKKENSTSGDDKAQEKVIDFDSASNFMVKQISRKARDYCRFLG
jgi:hypothetical protein